MGNITSLIDPFAAAYQAYSSLDGSPLLSGYDFKTNPTAGAVSGGDDTSPEQPATPATPNWGTGYSGATDRENHDASEPTERGPYGWEKDYWGGDFAPNYSLMDNLKTFAYGRSLPSQMKFGNLLMGLVNPFSPTLSLMNPLNSPGVISGMKQFSQNYNLDYNQLRQAVQTAYGGSTTGKRGGFLSGLLSMFKTPSTTNMNAIVNATDTLRGVLGLTTPGWQEVFNNPNFSLMDEFKHYDPYAQGFLSPGIVDPYMATQFMDAYGASGQTPSAVNANYAFDDDVYGTGILGLMVDPNIAATSKIGFLQGIKEGKNMGAGFDPDATANPAAVGAADGFKAGLSGWANGTVSTETMLGLLDTYADDKTLTNKQLADKYGGKGIDGVGAASSNPGVNDGTHNVGGDPRGNLGDGKDDSSSDDGPGTGTSSEGRDDTCVPAGTMVRMADGSLKPVEEIEIGDRLLTVNLENGMIEPDEVVELHAPIRSNMATITFTDGTTLRATVDHLVRTAYGEWASVDPQMSLKHAYTDKRPIELEPGIRIAAFGDMEKTVKSVSVAWEQTQAYDPSVRKNRNFFADGILVHNCAPGIY